MVEEKVAVYRGQVLVAGRAEGAVLHCATGLSFWGGVDPISGIVIDRSHPLHGQSIAGRILAIPAGRGSCTGSAVLLQLIVNRVAPAAMVFSTREEILTLGAFVAEELYGLSLPMLMLATPDFAALANHAHVSIDDGLVVSGQDATVMAAEEGVKFGLPATDIALSAQDEVLLGEASSAATRIAMRIILRMAKLLGARRLIDIGQVHVDGCIYTGPASLDFARRLVELGGRVAVPTTLNAISVDQQNWRQQGTDPALSEAASDLADAYLALGAKPSFTCAPYLRADAPASGSDIAWAESNAVVFANSVLGARTMKYPDFLDILIALTGRAPEAGCHLVENRRAKLVVHVARHPSSDDSFYPLLGYRVGMLAPSVIPVVVGLEEASPSVDDLKAFGAAFATTSGAPMFHIVGITPEAPTLSDACGEVAGLPEMAIDIDDLADVFDLLNSAEGEDIDLVALGNPHFSFAEFKVLAELCRGRKRAPGIEMTITTSRITLGQVQEAGLLDILHTFGTRIIVDACWCTVIAPIVPPKASAILTNSGKYAHYGPGLTGKAMRFAGLAACVTAAVTGRLDRNRPPWLMKKAPELLPPPSVTEW